MKLKIGDRLKCISKRPYSAPVELGEYVTVTSVGNDNTQIQFKTEWKATAWYGDLNSGHWELPRVELKNK